MELFVVIVLVGWLFCWGDGRNFFNFSFIWYIYLYLFLSINFDYKIKLP